MKSSMAGWIVFAGVAMMVIGGVDFFQGLIAILEDEYFVPSPATGDFLVVDLTAWGWFWLLWGCLLVLVGLGLLAAQGWARWTAIIMVSLNILLQLGFVGTSEYPLWALTAITLNIFVLFALTARWEESKDDLGAME